MRDLKSQRDSIMWKLYQFCSIITIQIFSGFDLTTSSYKNHGDRHFSWLGTVRPDSDNKPDMGGGCFEKWLVENTILKRWVNETVDVEVSLPGALESGHVNQRWEPYLLWNTTASSTTHPCLALLSPMVPTVPTTIYGSQEGKDSSLVSQML